MAHQLTGKTIASTYEQLIYRTTTVPSTGTTTTQLMTSEADQTDDIGLPLYIGTERVGIGTATPASELHLHADSGSAVFRISQDAVGGTTNAKILFQCDADSADKQAHVGLDQSEDTIKMVWGSTFDGSVEGIIVKDGGNVGIGNTSPGQKLEIDSGSIEVGNGYGIGTGLSSPYTYVKFDNSGQNTLQLASAGDVNVFIDSNANTANGKFRIHKDTISAGTNELFRVQEDGNVGIGIAAPTAKLHVVQADNQIGLSVTQTATTDTNYPIAWFKDEESTMETGEQGVVIQADVADPSTGGAYYFISCWDDTASMGWLTAASATQINTAFTQASDVRYKKDIEDWDLNGLGVINSLKLRTFTYNDVGYKGKHDGVKAEGFIADEVYEVWKPGADGTPGQMKKELIEGTGSTVENNNPKLEDGSANPDYIAPEYRDIIKPMGVTEGAFIRPMIKAIQELSAKVEALENA